MKAIRILWDPRGTAQAAAESPLWVPLVILGVAAALADYPLLFQLTPAGLAQARIDNTPNGMTPVSILGFLAMRWAAPVLLPALAWAAGRAMRFYIYWVLDRKVGRSGVARITAYAFLPLAVERLLPGTVALVCGGSCDRFNPLATNLAFLFDPTKTSLFWYELAHGLDVFSVWTVVVTSIALGKFAAEKPGSIWPGLVAPWVIVLFLRSWLLD